MRERRQAIVFLAAWLVALLVAWAAVRAVAPKDVARDGILPARLVIRGAGWTISYAATTSNNTVFGLLREANATLGFSLRWVEYGWPYDDVYVTAINGTANDGSRNLWWQYCLNGAYGSVGASHQEVSSGDLVTWTYAAPGGDDLCR